jgi:hypothetical protein
MPPIKEGRKVAVEFTWQGMWTPLCKNRRDQGRLSGSAQESDKMQAGVDLRGRPVR